MEGTSVYSKPDFLNNYHDKFMELFKSYIYGTTNDDDNRYNNKTLNKTIPIPSFYYNTTHMTTDEIYDKIEADIVAIYNSKNKM